MELCGCGWRQYKTREYGLDESMLDSLNGLIVFVAVGFLVVR